jgi:hypothetical protein
LNAVAVPQGRNLQTGNVFLNQKRIIINMHRAVAFFLAIFSLVFNFGCGMPPTNSPVTNNNGNTVVNSTPANIQQMPPATNGTPGAPLANQTANIAKGTTPTPGINPATAVRKIKPGEKIPGIPDAATVKRQMTQPVDPSTLPPEFRRALANQNVGPSANVNAAPSMMMKKKPQ